MDNKIIKFFVLSLSVIIILMTMIFGAALAADTYSIDLKYGSAVIPRNEYYKVKAGEEIDVYVISPDPVFVVYYCWDSGTTKEVSVVDNYTFFDVPSYSNGTKHKLTLRARTTNGYNISEVNYLIQIDKDAEKSYSTTPTTPTAQTNIEIDLYPVPDSSTKVQVNGRVIKNPGNQMRIETVTNAGLDKMVYQWDKEKAIVVTESQCDISLPANGDAVFAFVVTIPNFEPSSKHTLLIQALAKDGTYSQSKSYNIEMKEADAIEGKISAKTKSGAISETTSRPSILKAGETITAIYTPEENFISHGYHWDKEDEIDLGNKRTFTVPDFEDGSKHTLYIAGRLINDRTTVIQAFVVYIENPKDEEEPEVIIDPQKDDDKGDKDNKDNIDDEEEEEEEEQEVIKKDLSLEVEDWMKENKELSSLAISLRNDSNKYTKKNKNIYELGEEVVYYIDYKNGGNKINSEVKLELKLPLSFTVVDAFGGKINKNNNLITWTYDGMEKGASGTKVIKLKYKSLSKTEKKSEIVYPEARIYTGNSNEPKDVSTVINLIFKSTTTEILNEHEPYMLGDLEGKTFRPDDGISRAEGALVLARIFGINYSGAVVKGDEFLDINTTYEQAQKAIVACTKVGIISGFPDGTYRPNAKMTKAQFMTIIARYIEVKANDDGINGLAIKDLSDTLKLYKDSTTVYITGSSTVSNHWAIPYVSLLVRLNMTPVSSSHLDLGLDNEITRAEVAQLVNFYLFRAPRESGTTIFTDVSKNHKLFGDILEATMETHTYKFTNKGTEK